MSRTFRLIKFGNYLNMDAHSTDIIQGSNKKTLKDCKNIPRYRIKKNRKRQIKKLIKYNCGGFDNPYNKARMMENYNFFLV